MEIDNYDQLFHGIECNKCAYFVDMLFGIDHTCIKCKQDATTAARSRFEVVISDDSGTLNALIEGNLADEQFGCDADYFLQKTIQGQTVTEEAFRNTTTKPMMIHLMAFDSNSGGSNKTQFRIVHVQPPLPAPDTLSSSSDRLMLENAKLGNAEHEPSSSSIKRKLLFDSTPANNALEGTSSPIKLENSPSKDEKESDADASAGDGDNEDDFDSSSPKKKMLLDSPSDSTKSRSPMAAEKLSSDAEARSQ